MALTCFMISSGSFSPSKYSVTPSSLSILSILSSVGLLRSMSTKITFLPVKERLTAKLDEIKLFPSPDILEVMSIFLWEESIPRKDKEILSFRNSSATKLLVLFQLQFYFLIYQTLFHQNWNGC